MEITVGICEDIREDMEELCRITEEILGKSRPEVKYVRFYSGEELIRYTGERRLDLLLLDIELPGINGIEIKNRFQKISEDTMIIFVTNHEEFMQEAFGMKVYGFVQKEKMREHLSEMLPNALRMLNDYVMVGDSLDSRDIVYIKAEHVYSQICLSNGEYRLIRQALKEYETLLADVGFIKIHRSYLVNAAYIDEWRNGGGSNIPWSASGFRSPAKGRAGGVRRLL